MLAISTTLRLRVSEGLRIIPGMQPLPPTLDIHNAFQQVCELYQSLSHSFQQLAAQHQQVLTHGSTDPSRAKMNVVFNTQFGFLNQKMQTEARKFTMLSNIMKTKHDTAKNAISNVR